MKIKFCNPVNYKVWFTTKQQILISTSAFETCKQCHILYITHLGFNSTMHLERISTIASMHACIQIAKIVERKNKPCILNEKQAMHSDLIHAKPLHTNLIHALLLLLLSWAEYDSDIKTKVYCVKVKTTHAYNYHHNYHGVAITYYMTRAYDKVITTLSVLVDWKITVILPGSSVYSRPWNNTKGSHFKASE